MKIRFLLLFAVAMFMAVPVIKAQTVATPPSLEVLKDTSNYEKYAGRVKEYVNWIVKTPFANRDTALWRKVDEFVMAWIEGSPDVNVRIGGVIEPILKDRKDKGGYELLIAYMGGIAVYELNNPKDKDEANIEYSGLKAMLEMVKNNGDLFVNAKAVKKYKSMDDAALKQYVKDCLGKDGKG